MKGYPVGVDKMLSKSPRVKIMVTAMIKPMAMFNVTDHMIALGKVTEASLISSAVVALRATNQTTLKLESGREGEIRLHMCTEQSYPIKQLKGVVRPIMADKPVVDQPPLLVNFNRTS